MPVVGIISDGTPEAYAARRVAGLLRGLRESGFVEGRSVAIEYRWARGNYDLLPGLAADLVRRQVGVIVTGGSEAVTRAAQAATKAIPIVATMAGDPVKRGLVASLARRQSNRRQPFHVQQQRARGEAAGAAARAGAEGNHRRLARRREHPRLRGRAE
jgi:putative ABC transport system substrate-binding protein